jgi:uncharacterized protein YjiS (DUF1127 family)
MVRDGRSCSDDDAALQNQRIKSGAEVTYRIASIDGADRTGRGAVAAGDRTMDYKPQFEMPGAEPTESRISAAELNRHIAYARVLRSKATAAMLGAAFRALARPLRASVAGAAGWWRQRGTVAALSRCNDRVLADIGIAREDIR